MDASTQVNSPIHQNEEVPISVTTTEPNTSLPLDTIAVPPLHYEEEPEAQTTIFEKSKERYREAKDEKCQQEMNEEMTRLLRTHEQNMELSQKKV